MILHTVQDDFNLTANGDTERGTTAVAVVTTGYFLVDELGNFLVDEAGNFLVGSNETSQYPQIIHADPDDFQLNAE